MNINFFLFVIFVLIVNFVSGNECGSPPGGPGGRFPVEIPRSWDPNEMAGPMGFGDDKRYVLPGDILEYTVYFENQATASAAAQEITIDADISPYLDWSTFEFGDIDLAGQAMTDLRERQQGEAIISLKGRSDFVKVVVSFGKGHLKLYIRSWDKTRSKNGYWPEDDYDGILQPNDDTGRGEGHFTYRIAVKDQEDLASLLASEPLVVSASADIVFDANEVIPTDPAWYNTIYNEAPMAVTNTDVSPDTRLPLDTTSIGWKDGGGSQEYDVTFRQVDEAGKVLDSWTVEGLINPSCPLPMKLASGAFYRWQITSKNDFGTAKSTEMTFQAEYDGDVIEVTPGWNLLAVTRSPDEASEVSLLQKEPYVLNVGTHVFQKADALKLGLPFWIYATSASAVVFTGKAEDGWTLKQPDRAGWHLFGIVADNAVPGWMNTVWEWDGKKFSKPSSEEMLKKGHAYWILVPPQQE